MAKRGFIEFSAELLLSPFNIREDCHVAGVSYNPGLNSVIFYFAGDSLPETDELVASSCIQLRDIQGESSNGS